MKMSLTSSLAEEGRRLAADVARLEPVARAPPPGRARPRCAAGPPRSRGAASITPSTSAIRLAISSAFSRRTVRSGPKMRTTIDSLVPVRTSLIALAQVGLHVAVDARVALDGPVHRGERLVVVDVLVDADPVLAEVHAVDLVGRAAPGRCASRSCARRGSRAGPGTPRIEMRFSSEADVDGSVSQCMRKSRSLKFGSSCEPERGVDHAGRRGSATRRGARSPGCGRRMTAASTARVAALEHAQQRRLAAAAGVPSTASAGTAPA